MEDTGSTVRAGAQPSADASPASRRTVPLWVLVTSLAAFALMFGGAILAILVHTAERPARETVLRSRLVQRDERVTRLEKDRAALADALLGLTTGDLVSRTEPTGTAGDGVYFALLYDTTGTPTAANVALDWGQVYVGEPAATEGLRQLRKETSSRVLFKNARPVVSRLPLLPEASIVVTRGSAGPRSVSVPEFLRLVRTDQGRIQLLRTGYWVRVSRGEIAGLTQQYSP